MNDLLYSKNIERIEDRTLKVGVLGLGYVGLPLALEFAKAGYETYGIDIDQQKVDTLYNCQSYIHDISNEEVNEVINNTFFPTSDVAKINELDAVSICVPTPLTKSYQPDMTYIQEACKSIRQYIKKGLIIILESTTYPGTTEELFEKQLHEDGYIAGKDYFLCYSPERVDPANETYNTKNTPKVMGGTTNKCTDIGVLLYDQIIDTLIPVSSPKVAEMSKLLENTFRSVNIAFVNEMALLCDKLGIDIWETIDAAATKPFGFMKFQPGPGIGGHCIPLDPMYLSYKAKESNFYSRFIEVAQEINKSMPSYVINKIGDGLNEITKPIRGSRILLMGMAYKQDTNDVRESPGLEVYELLKEKGAIVDFNDPHADYFYDKYETKVFSKPLIYESLQDYDCVVLLTNHSVYSYKDIIKNSRLIIDTRNAFKDYDDSKIVRLGVSTNGEMMIKAMAND